MILNTILIFLKAYHSRLLDGIFYELCGGKQRFFGRVIIFQGYAETTKF